MKYVTLFLVLLLPLVAFGQVSSPIPIAKPPAVKATPTPFPDLTTLSGRTLKNARVFRVEPDGITYMFTGGMVKVPFADLSDEVRKQYGYDPQKAAAFTREDDALQTQIAAQAVAQNNAAMTSKRLAEIGSASDMDKRDADNRERVRLAGLGQGIARQGIVIRAHVQQVLAEGALVSYKIRVGLYGWPEDEEADMIYIAGLQKGHVDGDRWEGAVYPFGTYQYDAVSGAQNTVKGYAKDVLVAAALSEKQ